MTDQVLMAELLQQPEGERLAWLRRLPPEAKEEFAHVWPLWARAAQLQPPGDWQLWLILAGRGFGKTRAGAEWVRDIAERDPTARIALVGASLGEVRSVMVEGESGLLSIGLPQQRPQFEPSLRRLVWPNGALATLYSAGEPESLRGPQHSHACRTDSERAVFERKPRPHRCTLARRGRGPDRHSADQSARGAGLAGGCQPDGGLERSGGQDCQLSARPVAVSSTARRPARA